MKDYKLPPIGTLKLKGEAAAEFARRLFRPTKEEIEERRKVIEELDRTVNITETEDGFIAEVEGLDLSFLDEEDAPTEELYIKI